MPLVGFEHTISTGERPQTYTLDCTSYYEDVSNGTCGIYGEEDKYTEVYLVGER
jgi:hypothetical protein